MELVLSMVTFYPGQRVVIEEPGIKATVVTTKITEQGVTYECEYWANEACMTVTLYGRTRFGEMAGPNRWQTQPRSPASNQFKAGLAIDAAHHCQAVMGQPSEPPIKANQYKDAETDRRFWLVPIEYPKRWHQR